jgi:uncharacterized protein (DUF2236 family)
VGPETITWQRASDARLHLVMLYPLLLQVAHPVVGAGVSDFSDFRRRPWQRLLGTLDYAAMLVYGGERAIDAGRALRAMHAPIRGVADDGTPYHALDPEAYAWVHATLIEAYITGHERFGSPMSPAQRERFYTEYRALGRLIGVGEAELPPSWESFRDYRERMFGMLRPTAAVREVLEAVLDPVSPPLGLPDLLSRPLWGIARVPAGRAVWLGGVWCLGPALRSRLGIGWSARDEREVRLLGWLSRSSSPLLPRGLRESGPLLLRLRRRAIAVGPLGR